MSYCSMSFTTFGKINPRYYYNTCLNNHGNIISYRAACELNHCIVMCMVLNGINYRYIKLAICLAGVKSG